MSDSKIVKPVKSKGKKLSAAEAKVVSKHLVAIEAEHKKLQQYLTSVGIQPAAGWKDPAKYKLVSGIIIGHSGAACTEGCTECSVVCFDDPCDCTECGDDRHTFEDIWNDQINIENILAHNIQVKVTPGRLK
jgi:hypothetical protein